jgi:hypothetical protein
MILSKADIQHLLAQPQAAFPAFDEPRWVRYLTIGQPAYLWSIADMGDAHLVDSDPCDSVEAAIASLKSALKRLFDG